MLHSKLVSSSMNMIRIVASCSRRQMVGTAQRKIQNRMKLGGGGEEERKWLSSPLPLSFSFLSLFLSSAVHFEPLPHNWTPETDYHNNRDQFNGNYFFEIPGSLLVGSFWSLICWNSLPFLSHKPGPTNTHPSPASRGEQNGKKVNWSHNFLKFVSENTICLV